MFVVVAYDIVDNKRRTKVMKALEGYGHWVQYSVFECDLERKVYREMVGRLTELIDPEQDNIRLYHLCNADVKRIAAIGRGAPIYEAEVFAVI